MVNDDDCDKTRNPDAGVPATIIAGSGSASEAAHNPSARAGLTIKALMIVVAIVGCLLAMPRLVSVGILLASPLIAPILAKRMFARRERKPAAYFFSGFAALVNVFYISSCFAPSKDVLLGLCLGWAIFAVAPSVILGSAWAALASAADASPRRSPKLVWSVVFVAATLPLLTLWSLWPIRLLFVAARPQIEYLANEAAAGRNPGAPQTVGLFRFTQIRFAPSSGSVSLFMDPVPGHSSCFFRKGSRPSTTSDSFESRSVLSVHLADDWWYFEKH